MCGAVYMRQPSPALGLHSLSLCLCNCVHKPALLVGSCTQHWPNHSCSQGYPHSHCHRGVALGRLLQPGTRGLHPPPQPSSSYATASFFDNPDLQNGINYAPFRQYLLGCFMGIIPTMQSDAHLSSSVSHGGQWQGATSAIIGPVWSPNQGDVGHSPRPRYLANCRYLDCLLM